MSIGSRERRRERRALLFLQNGKQVPLNKTRRIKPPVQKTDPEYIRLWKIVDGAVRDALSHHPDYVSPTTSVKVVRNSIVKRVTGAVLARDKLLKKEGRLG